MLYVSFLYRLPKGVLKLRLQLRAELLLLRHYIWGKKLPSEWLKLSLLCWFGLLVTLNCWICFTLLWFYWNLLSTINLPYESIKFSWSFSIFIIEVLGLRLNVRLNCCYSFEWSTLRIPSIGCLLNLVNLFWFLFNLLNSLYNLRLDLFAFKFEADDVVDFEEFDSEFVCFNLSSCVLLALAFLLIFNAPDWVFICC